MKQLISTVAAALLLVSCREANSARTADQPRPELEEEDDADGGQLDQRRGDVEQQEIEHHVDALGAALDDLGERAGAPL